MTGGPRGRGAAGLWLPLLGLLLILGCSADHQTSSGRTQRETDSVIGESKLPGAHVVKRARDAQDSAQAAAAALDTVGNGN